jgi:hypothetical protein
MYKHIGTYTRFYAGKRSAVFTILLAVAGFSTTHTSAQTLPQSAFSQVKGVVLDSASGQPVPLASLNLVNKKNTLLVRATGSESGYFMFGQVPSDTYSLTISGAGYQARTINRILVKTAGLDIRLDTIRLQSTRLATTQPQFVSSRVKGVVVDSASGRPLPLMSMSLVNKRRTTVRRESGSDQGFFLFDQVAPDTYTLIITGLGYETKIIQGVQVNATDRAVQFEAIRLRPTGQLVKQPAISARPVRYAKPMRASAQPLVSRQL